MIRPIRYISVLCLLLLSSVYCRAEIEAIAHNFQELSGGNITFNTPSNTVGTTTDGIVYTCSSGAAFSASTNSGNQIAIFLEASGAQVVTTQIANLDSVRIYYAPTATKSMTVSVSRDGSAWNDLVITQPTYGIKAAKIPSPNDYYVRIKRSSDNVYIKEIRFYYIDLSGCPSCFLYKP